MEPNQKLMNKRTKDSKYVIIEKANKVL